MGRERSSPNPTAHEIVTPHERKITFKYDKAGRIVQAADDRGLWTRYCYNADGLLADVAHSTGSERHNEYSGVLMTTVRDEQGRMLVENGYYSGVVVQQEYADGFRFSYDYLWNAERTAARQVSITLPDGSRKTSFPEITVHRRLPSQN